MEKILNLFARIAKVDEAKREVWGAATAEMVDKEGEIFDYKSSKPFFEKWSSEISKATDGKSLGNVREMHQPSAVGKLVDITFDDEMKEIRVGAKIVDDVAWKKCAAGVYTGFSIGGKYEDAWKDGEYVRFTANPAEISVVDNPCVPGAHFTAVKADGTCEVRKFAPESVRQCPTPDKTEVEPLKKDLSTVSNLAYILQSACYIQMDAAYEAEYEADGSELPAELAAWVKEGAAILQRMTEEELNELVGTMKATQDRMRKDGKMVIGIFQMEKKGAKHSAATRKHLDGIQKCMDTAQEHLDALGKDDMAESAPVDMEKVSAATPQINEGDAEMLDPKEKEQLDKAAADSAKALTQTTEINTKLDTLAGLIHKFVETQVSKSAGPTVARTAVPGVPSVTVQKSDDSRPATVTDEDAELTREMSPEEVQKLSPAQREKRYIAMTKVAYQTPKQVFHTPQRGGL